MTHRFYLPVCTRKQVVWMAFPSQKTPYPVLGTQSKLKNGHDHYCG